MENRQPTYPGRVVLTPVPGAENTYDMTRADDPTVEGTPLNKETLLQDATCLVLDIPNTSVPNDALMKLALGIGQYGYAVTVLFQDGSPVEGAILTGIVAPNSGTAITDGNGLAVGVASSQHVIIGVNSPFLDVKSVSNVEIQSTGILTSCTVFLPFNDAEYETIAQSTQIDFSPFVISYDLTAVGGGGGGMAVYSSGGVRRGSTGGGGGYVSTALNITDKKSINVIVGAGGQPGNPYTQSTAGAGGTTTVSDSVTNATILSANGGGGATNQNSGGAGNGNGGSNYWTGGNPATYGGDSTSHLFDDNDLPLAGGGGGGGVYNGSEIANGGSPYGGNGAGYLNSPTSVTSPTGPGGGGAGSWTGDATAGYVGCVYIRWHYVDEVKT